MLRSKLNAYIVNDVKQCPDEEDDVMQQVNEDVEYGAMTEPRELCQAFLQAFGVCTQDSNGHLEIQWEEGPRSIPFLGERCQGCHRLQGEGASARLGFARGDGIGADAVPPQGIDQQARCQEGLPQLPVESDVQGAYGNSVPVQR